MALTSEDRDWLETKFNRVHERCDGIEEQIRGTKSEIHRIELDTTRHKLESASIAQAAVAAHEESRHNAKKTWGLIGTVIAACVGAVELLKYLMKGDKS